MGLYDTSDPGRAGYDVKQFDGWSLINIIKAFAVSGLDTEIERMRMKRAILISNECARLANFGRINA